MLEIIYRVDFFLCLTDHSAFTKIFSSRHSGIAGTRIIWWQANVIPYSLEVEYAAISRFPWADTLSRFAVTKNVEEMKEEYKNVALLDGEDAVTYLEIQEAASTNEEVLTLKKFVWHTFPESAKLCPQVIRLYFQFRRSLSEVSGIVLAWCN